VETEPGVPSIFAVNVLAPYILTVLIERPERLVGLRGEQALRCSARICRRPAVGERPIQRAGAGMGADEDGRLFSSG